MSIALAVIILALIIARKPLARAAKRYINRKRAAVRKWFQALARRAWLSAKVTVARRTIGLQ